MENFEAWVSRESEKLGINFASLDLEVRNRLLEELMSGLENGFRSRMDSPDLRFGKRRNIIKEKDSEEKQMRAAQSKEDDSTRRYRDWETDRKSTRLNSSHSAKSRMPSSA